MKWIFLVLVALSILSAPDLSRAGILLPTMYSSAEIKINLIDADTGKPVDSVLAMAYWKNYSPGFTHCSMESGCIPSCFELVNVVTASSDAQGRLSIPGWSGKWGHCVYMPGDQPDLILYKPGYEAVLLPNATADDESQVTVRTTSHSTWDGQTVKLYQLGPHRYGTFLTRSRNNIYSGNGWIDGKGDNYVINLQRYSSALENALEDVIDSSPPCFWKEAGPAMLLLLQEEVRLQGYAKQGFSLFDRHLSDPASAYGTRWSCGDQTAYIKALKAEADTVVRETPPGSVEAVVTDSQTSPTRIAQGQFTNSEEQLAGSAAEGIVYRVTLDSKNPNFLQVSMAMPKDPRVDTGFDFARWRDTALFNRYIHNSSCDGYYGGQPMQTKSPAINGCTWITTLDPTTSRTSSPLTYDFISQSWLLSDYMLKRSPGIKVSEYVQVDAPADETVITPLRSAGPRLWVLPTLGLPFTIRIIPSSGSAGKAASTTDTHACIGNRNYVIVAFSPCDGSDRSQEIDTGDPMDDSCVKALPKAAIEALTQAFPQERIALSTDFAPGYMPKDHCGSVVQGNFSGSGVGYAVIMLGKYLSSTGIRAVVPSGAGWVTYSIPGSMCAPWRCALLSAKPGTYHRMTPTPQFPFLGEALDSLSSDYDVLIVDGALPNGSPARSVMGLREGKWQFTVIDPNNQVALYEQGQVH